MRLHRFALTFSLLTAPAFGQAELNRLELDNGGDILWFITSPYIGSDPVNGNFDGNLFWKVLPRQAVQRVAGAAPLWGVEFHLFDLDWSDFAPLWAYMVTESVEGTDLNLEPVLNTTGPGVIVPLIPNVGLTSPTEEICPRPGYVGGWVISDLFTDTSTGSLIPLMQASDPASDDYFRADGTVDWSFVQFYPGHNQTGGQDVWQPSPNGCGSGFSGSASFMVLGSADGLAPFGDGGENQAAVTLRPDGAGTGGTTQGFRSRYGGFQIGGKGAPSSELIPETQAQTADLAFFLGGGSTLSLRVNTQFTVKNELEPTPGLAGLELPIGWDTVLAAPALKNGDDGVPGSSAVTVGAVLYDSRAEVGVDFGALGANVDLPLGSPLDLLVDAGLCLPALGGAFCLNPANPIFAPVFANSLSALSTYADDPDNPGEKRYLSPQYPIVADPTLIGVTIAWQGWTFRPGAPPGSEIARSSNVARMNLRGNANVW